MEESKEVLNLKKINYKWCIKNFNDYLNFIDDHESITISSKVFKIKGDNNLAFFFKIIIFSRSIICYLCRSPNTKYTKLIGEISLRGCGKTLVEEKFKIDYLSYVERTPEYLVKLTFNSRDLLCTNWALYKHAINRVNYDADANDNLLVTCELTVLDSDIKIQSIYTPQPYPLMKDHFEELLKNETGTDIVFEVDDKEFKAHKSILSARSPVFTAMFKHDMVEKKTSRVKIVDISKEIFELLLHFIYTDEIKKPLDLNSGSSLLKAASKYQLVGLQNLCATQLFKLITVNNATNIRDTAEAYHLTDFVKSIDAFTQSRRT